MRSLLLSVVGTAVRAPGRVLATAEGLAAPLVDTATRITGALVEPVLAPVLDAVGVVASGPAPPLRARPARP